MLVTFRRVVSPKLRVFGLPYAGGHARWLRPWEAEMPPDVELSAVTQEERKTSMAEVIAALAPTLPVDAPFVLYGHSIGAWIAYELARARPAQCRALVVSGRPAPDAPRDAPPIRGLPDAAFVMELMALYDAIPREVLDSPWLLEAMLPLARADVAVGETYGHAAGSKLEVPIHVYGGADDRHVSSEALAGWQRMTRAETTVEIRPGDHFFVDDPAVRREICARISRYV